MKSLAIAAVGVALVVGTACGGEGELDTEQLSEAAREAGARAVREPIERVEDFGSAYFGALLEQDLEKVHSLLSQRCRDAIPLDEIEAAPETAPFFAEFEDGEVRVEVRQLGEVSWQEDRVTVQGKIVVLLGDSETILLSIDDAVTLVREDEEWRLDSCSQAE